MEIFGNRFFPITWTLGFVKAPLDVVAAGMAEWMLTGTDPFLQSRHDGGFEANVGLLEPLVSASPVRFLWVQTANPDWCAIFDNIGYALGTQPDGPVAALSDRLRTEGAVLSSVEGTAPKGRMRWGDRLAGRRLVYHDGASDIVRTVMAHIDFNRRWNFEAAGPVQWFEDESFYDQRRIKDRLSHELLDSYAHKLGLRPFDDDFYSGPTAFFEKQPSWTVLRPMTLAETQAYDPDHDGAR